MNLVKKGLSVLLAVTVMSSLTACGGTTTSEGAERTDTSETAAVEAATESEKVDDGLKIGYISPGPDTWYSRAEEGAKWAAEKAGAEFIAVNSNRDSETEQTNIDNLINEGVDVIVTLSWNEAGSVSCAEKCKEAGIGCVVFDACGVMKNHDVELTASVDFDWAGMGAMYQEWMDKAYSGEDYVFISGTEDSVVCQTLEKSLREATEASGKNKLVDVRYGQYDPETAANAAEDLVNSGLEFSLIGTINEDCAAAIVTRLQDLGVADQYHVFAQNGSDTGIKLMQEGALEFTVSSSPGLEGAVAVFAAVDSITNGKEPNQYISCPIAAVSPDMVENPEVVIPWAVDEEAWSKVIVSNFSEYEKYLK
ncbi:MAG: sugar ABC transporter substrate-binding protein [Lachnospiraceae bacterium]|nr:sugar ABC transporter substrate-binding protein [Lachnospiraceae bacterium]